MAPTCKVSLPAGSLMVQFKGEIPRVSGVDEESPVFGLMKVGYTFEELILGDGTSFTDLDTFGLVSALNEYSDDPDRKIKMEMTLPNETSVVLSSGPHDLVITEKWGKAILTGVLAGSPLKKHLRVGMVVDSLAMEDGYKIMGHTADEFNDALAASEDEIERTLVLKSPSSVLSTRGFELGPNKDIVIPAGTSEELGLTIVGSVSAKIYSIDVESPLFKAMRSGYYVEGLVVDGGEEEFMGLSGANLMQCLDATANSSDRILKLVNTNINPSGMATIKLTGERLPEEGLLLEGLSLFGTPATIMKVEETSALFGKVFKGFSFTKFGWTDGTEFEQLDEEELEEVYRDSIGLEGRYMILQNFVKKEANAVECFLPAGKLGLSFKGTPPEVKKVKEGSPLEGVVELGMVADVLTLPDGMTKYYEMTTETLTNLLMTSNEDENRKLRFIKLDEGATMTPKPIVSMQDEITVPLPAGKIGVSFKGSAAPCKISKIKDESPLVNKIAVGMAVDYVTINGRSYPDLNASELMELLVSTSGERYMTLRDPALTDNFMKIPDEVEVFLPTGKLGCTFQGTPPVAKSFKDTSPIAASVPPGMFIDKLMFKDGYYVAGMSTKELGSLLSKYAALEGRSLILKNIKTQEPSEREVSLPTETTFTLPTGKLGISFKGSKIARIHRLHDETKMLGLAYEGMIVDTVSIPGGSSFTCCTAKELGRILKDTKNVGGRLMTLKHPDNTDTISVRNITNTDKSIGGTSQDMSASFSSVSTSGGLSLDSVRM